MLWLAVAACVGAPARPPAPAPAEVGDVDAVVAATTELLRAWSAGPADVLKVLEERFGARAVGDPSGLIVQSSAAAPALGFVVDLMDVPACRDPRSGVVVGEPPRVSGCGAHAMATLAAFVVAVERNPALRLEVVVDRAPTPGPRRIWAGTGGALVRADDDDVFDLDLVDAGAVTIELRRPGGRADLDGLVVAAGRALAWRGPTHRSAVAVARAARRGIFAVGDDDDEDLVRERCRLEAPPTPTAARLWCHLLPGRAARDVFEGVLAAVDDPRIVLEVVATRPPSSTAPTDPLAAALSRRLQAEGVAVRPGMRIEPEGSCCAPLRAAGTPCVGGVPLVRPAAARGAVGSVDEVVDVADIARMVARVDDVVAAVSVDQPRATDRGP